MNNMMGFPTMGGRSFGGPMQGSYGQQMPDGRNRPFPMQPMQSMQPMQPRQPMPSAQQPQPEQQPQATNLGFGGLPAPNPYLGQQANTIAQNATLNFQNNVAPTIRGNAQAAGGYGGSRQGIAEGLAMQGLNRDILAAQAELYGKAYDSDANRANTRSIAELQNTTTMRGQDINRDLGYAGLTNAKDIASLQAETSRYGADRSADASMANARTSADASRYSSDQSLAGTKYASDATYNLGMGNLGYNYAGLDRAIANDNVANTIAMGNFGLNAYDKMMGYDGSAVTAANNIQNTPLNYLGQFSGVANNAGGLGGTGSSTTPYFGNPLMGALGGYQFGTAASQAFGNTQGSSVGPGIGYGNAGTLAGTSYTYDLNGNLVPII